MGQSTSPKKNNTPRLPLWKRLQLFLLRFRYLPTLFWAVLASIFGIADFLTWTFLDDSSPSERVYWTVSLVILAFVATIIALITNPSVDEKMAQARLLRRAAREEFNEKNYRRSIDLLQKAVHLDSGEITAWGLLGRSLIRIGEFEQAIEPLTRAIDGTRVNKALFLHNRGFAYVMTQRYGHALDDFEECLKEDPKRTSTRRWKAIIWIQFGRLDLAMKEVEEAIKTRPRYICGHSTKSIIHIKLLQIDKANTELKKCISLKPDDANDYYCIAQVHAQLGDKEQAIRMLHLALEQDPKFNARVGQDPFLESLHSEPSFQSIVSRSNVVR